MNEDKEKYSPFLETCLNLKKDVEEMQKNDDAKKIKEEINKISNSIPIRNYLMDTVQQKNTEFRLKIEFKTLFLLSLFVLLIIYGNKHF